MRDQQNFVLFVTLKLLLTLNNFIDRKCWKKQSWANSFRFSNDIENERIMGWKNLWKSIHIFFLFHMKLINYSLMHKKTDKSIFKFFIYKSSRNNLFFFTCTLTGYVFNERSKEFWKNSNFENMTGFFLLRYLKLLL